MIIYSGLCIFYIRYNLCIMKVRRKNIILINKKKLKLYIKELKRIFKKICEQKNEIII